MAGALCKPRPERRNESATMKRVKLVTMMSRPGATESTVRIATSSMMRALAEAPPAGMSALRSTVCAAAGRLAARSATAAGLSVSLHHQSSDHERAHLPVAANRRPFIEVLADVLEPDRAFELAKETVRR